ncbi:MAG TPA: class I SAM-dependent methyltransferase [Methanosarcinaceae archaeon]|nr:class I SAM-dependent methyltransferase [Methanosarcinaceae archaeon]
MQQTGTDYTDISEVVAYDSRMQKLRNIKEEIKNILSCLDIIEGHSILEFGTGTGDFATEAAKHCGKVIAVDVSHVMLDFAKKKAAMQGVKNIEYHHAGFLTYEHRGEPLDAVVSQLALHHLPDFWKMIALRRVFGMLKDGGKLYLRDTVYSFGIEEHSSFFNNQVDKIREIAGEDMANDSVVAIREEYSTFSWIMEDLLKKAGFSIDEVDYNGGFIAVYICTKPRK